MTTTYKQAGSGMTRQGSRGVECIVPALHSVCSVGLRVRKSGSVNVFPSAAILMQLLARGRTLPHQLHGCPSCAFKVHLPATPACWALVCAAEQSRCANEIPSRRRRARRCAVPRSAAQVTREGIIQSKAPQTWVWCGCWISSPNSIALKLCSC